MFVSQPGLYKLVWDNTFSWFTKKTIRYRVSVLKPLMEMKIDVDKKVEFSSKIKISENLEFLTKIKISQNAKKDLSLNLKYDGKNRILNINQIFEKEKSIKNNDSFYISVPVILVKDSIRIFDQKSKVFNEYNFTKENEEILKSEVYFEQILCNFIEKVYIFLIFR